MTRCSINIGFWEGYIQKLIKFISEEVMAYDGVGGPAYDGVGGPCYAGIGGTGASCPKVCK